MFSSTSIAESKSQKNKTNLTENRFSTPMSKLKQKAAPTKEQAFRIFGTAGKRLHLLT